ncbi:DUF2232 domain-containing protein [Candidatus Palauibacter sp.]|uniref:DUF2232 domain-containing protein n=1 Tax=Candidatus Palauibacter sp. TaxID=3101350 RepID=UPI003C6F7A7E
MILLSPLNSSPLGLMAIVGVPTAVAILAFEPPQTGTAVLALLLLAGAAAGFGEATPLWYIERGWAVLLAGGFAISTTLAPGRPILDRSLMGVAIAGGTVGAMGAWRPDLPAALDRHVSGQFDRVLAMYDSRAFGSPVVDAAVRQFVGVWEAVYPAMLVLASVSALALCVYLLGRIRGEEAALPPLRHFRFSTHLVWVLILGLALLVLPAGDWADRAGGNMVTVMGGLYLLRGAAVLVWLGAAVISSGWVIAVWAIAALALYPVTIGTALVVGVSDTWLDLRSRLGVETREK